MEDFLYQEFFQEYVDEANLELLNEASSVNNFYLKVLTSSQIDLS